MPYFEVLNLPEIVLDEVLSYFSYDEIAQFRIVCKRFDSICKKLLNKGFVAVERFHSQSIKAVKVQLPRRESERRLHPMVRHCDVLSAIETRLSMLSMTYMKFVDVGLCCFIPGKVIDEIFRVLKYLKNCRTPSRAHDLLQELRDISSMAMEHFDEEIAPGLKNACLETLAARAISRATQASVSSVACANPNARGSYLTHEKLRKKFNKFQHRYQYPKKEIKLLKDQLNHLKARVSTQAKKISGQAVLISEQDTQIADMKHTLTEWDHKYGDLSTELSCAREEHSILAAAIALQCSYNKSSQSVPIMQPCSSRDSYDGGKRKLNDGEETSGLAKKSKLVNISCEEMGHANDKIKCG